MAVMKINNRKDKYTGCSRYQDDDAREDVYRYIFDTEHPYNSKKIKSNIVGGSHVDMSDPVRSMEEIAQMFHKDRGIRLKHIIISFSEDEILFRDMLIEAAQKISDRIGLLYQNVYAVHEDKAAPHIHIMMSTVNHINGYKYNAQQDRAWLVRIVADVMNDLEIDDFRVYGR